MTHDLPPEHLRDQNHFVLLLPELDEQFLTRSELIEFLSRLLQEHPHLIDADLQRYSSPVDQVQRLIETTCSVEIEPGQTVEWYAVRLRKNR